MATPVLGAKKQKPPFAEIGGFSPTYRGATAIAKAAHPFAVITPPKRMGMQAFYFRK
jgi:hypothetical protein